MDEIGGVIEFLIIIVGCVCNWLNKFDFEIELLQTIYKKNLSKKE